jgi:hypothetical protein
MLGVFFMTINWVPFALGLLLLVYPADRLLSSMIRLRDFDSFQILEAGAPHRPWWWVPLLWLDPWRSLAGTLLLKHALGIMSPQWTLTQKPAYWVMIWVLALGVFCQIFIRRDREALLAPMGFVAGMVVALMPLPLALIGLAMATMSVFAFRKFDAFFAVGLAMIALLGFLFQTSFIWIAPAVGVLGLPILLGGLTARALEMPTRTSAAPLV